MLFQAYLNIRNCIEEGSVNMCIFLFKSAILRFSCTMCIETHLKHKCLFSSAHKHPGKIKTTTTAATLRAFTSIFPLLLVYFILLIYVFWFIFEQGY